MRSMVPAFVCSSVLILPTFLAAADWPQYRADGQRSGYTAEQLPAELHLQWTYVAPHPPEPAWPDVYWQRQTYDLAYQPVVARGMLFYGSSADCKVYALDAATGRLRWSFFTDGPIRFAPAVWHDRVFVISDDGSGFDPAALPDPADPPSLEKVSGRGVLLMRTFVDEVVYNETGSAVTLTKRCRSAGDSG